MAKFGVARAPRAFFPSDIIDFSHGPFNRSYLKDVFLFRKKKKMAIL